MALQHLTPTERARLRTSKGRVGAEATYWAELLSAARAETAEVQRRFDRYEESTERALSRARRPPRYVAGQDNVPIWDRDVGE